MWHVKVSDKLDNELSKMAEELGLEKSVLIKLAVRKLIDKYNALRVVPWLLEMPLPEKRE